MKQAKGDILNKVIDLKSEALGRFVKNGFKQLKPSHWLCSAWRRKQLKIWWNLTKYEGKEVLLYL